MRRLIFPYEVITDHNLRLAPLHSLGLQFAWLNLVSKIQARKGREGGRYILEYCHYFNIRYLCLKWRALIYRAELLSGGWTRHAFWWYNQRGTMVGADLSVFSWEALLPDNDSDECTHICYLIHVLTSSSDDKKGNSCHLKWIWVFICVCVCVLPGKLFMGTKCTQGQQCQSILPCGDNFSTHEENSL